MSQFLNDIPTSLARGAFGGVSMSPERRGDRARTDHAETLEADLAYFTEQATKGGTLDKLEEEFARYRAGLTSRCRAWLASNARCVSSFIAGPSNFPAARMNKRSDIAHRRLGEYLDFRDRARRAVVRNLRPDLAPIKSSDADAVERYSAELVKLEALQARMKAANAAIRKHAKAGPAAQVAALMEQNIAESYAVELIKPDCCGRIGFADYQLSNNSANIRRVKARIEQVSRLQAQPTREVEGSKARLEDDPPANRVRLFFPGKPADEVRARLKSSGFRWTPTIGAWQAYRNYRTLDVAAQEAA